MSINVLKKKKKNISNTRIQTVVGGNYVTRKKKEKKKREKKKKKSAFLSFSPSSLRLVLPLFLESRLRNRRACILFLEQLDPVDLFQKVRVVRQKAARGVR